MSYWKGKRAVVTGGSAGLGRAVAETLVRQGARVAIAARGEEQLSVTAGSLKSLGGEVLSIQCDVISQADIDRLAATVNDAWGGVDLLCHSAGRSMRGTALGTHIDDYCDLLDTNFLAAVRCAQV